MLLLAALQPLAVEGIYTKKSPVLQVDTNSYDRLIARSNHASVSVSIAGTSTLAVLLLITSTGCRVSVSVLTSTKSVRSAKPCSLFDP